MKFDVAALLALALCAETGVAQYEVLTCSGSLRPNWEHCDLVRDYFDFRNDPELVHRHIDSECEWWFWDVEDGNCRITHCFNSQWQDADEERDGWDMNIRYNGIKERCEPIRAGGWHPILFPPNGGEGDAEFLSVYNDESGMMSRSLMARGSTVDHGNGFSQGTLSRAEFEQWLNETQLTKRDAQSKRQIEDDEEVWINFAAYEIRNPNEYARGPRLPSGTGYKYTVSESRTFSISTSIEIGAAWEIFTASAGIEISEEETFTNTEEFTYDIDCGEGGSGQLTFWPYYDYYEVEFIPSGERAEIWIPSVSGTQVSGEIARDCLN